LVGHCYKSSRLLADFRITVSLGIVSRNGGYLHPTFASTRREPAMGLADRRRDPPHAAHFGALEQLSAAPVDTGGYLARWYEGYLVPSRSTVFGLYLHYREHSYFWLNLAIQALATMWILQLTLRVFGLAKPWRLFGLSLVLTLTTALPWLASMLLTDIFAGLSVLSLFILVLHGDKISRSEKAALIAAMKWFSARSKAT